MNIAIVHYHLNRGGVTQVIVNQLRSLDASFQDNRRWRIAILYGGRRKDWPAHLIDQLKHVQVSLHEIASLDYDEDQSADPENLAGCIEEVLNDEDFSPDDSILHVHNHALGKNGSLPGALRILALGGYRLLLQVHDFAEDFRPENYGRLVQALAGREPQELPGQLYPQAAHVHYAVLNGRDYGVLERAGVAADNLHRLPNPVAVPGPLPARDVARDKLAARFDVPRDQTFLLYPVRCIRRKNVGEALLWSALAADRLTVGLTLAPLNVREQPYYQRWRQCAESLDVACRFGVGREGGLSFLENLAAADWILTTSVAEGFGLVFLESWLAGRPLVGRDLPEITADFVDAGIEFPGLRPGLLVPLGRLNERQVQETLIQAYQQALSAYLEPPAPAVNVREKARELTSGEVVDFGRLSSQLQRDVLSMVVHEAGFRDAVSTLNPWIGDALSGDAAATANTVQRNASAVRRGYSLERSGERLRTVYRAVRESSVAAALQSPSQGNLILHSFLDLLRLQPIRLE